MIKNKFNSLKNKAIKSKIMLVSFLMLFGSNGITLAQGNLIPKKKTLEVTVVNEDITLSPAIIEGFKNIIDEVYPKLMKDFNKNARLDITVKIDTTYDGVAYTSNGQVTVSSKWLNNKPNDLDLMTHEIMHIIQSYPNGAGPGWLTEGIADFVRYKYGVNNEKAGWSLTEFSEKQNYDNSYRITARFLVWVSQNYDKKLVNKMDSNLRSKTYSPDLWTKYTGFSVDQLWDIYSKNPKLKGV